MVLFSLFVGVVLGDCRLWLWCLNDGFGWCCDCCGCVGAGCLFVMVVVMLCDCVGFVLRA